MQTYKSSDIHKLAEVSKIQLVHWCNIGAIEPHIADRRRGGVRQFDQQNLIEVVICKKLNALRIPGHAIAKSMKSLRVSRPLPGDDEHLTFWERLQQAKKHWYVVLYPIEELLLHIADKTESELEDLRVSVTFQEKQPSDEIYLTDQCPREDLLECFDTAGIAVVVDVTRIVNEVGGL